MKTVNSILASSNNSINPSPVSDFENAKVHIVVDYNEYRLTLKTARPLSKRLREVLWAREIK